MTSRRQASYFNIANSRGKVGFSYFYFCYLLLLLLSSPNFPTSPTFSLFSYLLLLLQVCKFCLFKRSYRIGEDIVGTFDFTQVLLLLLLKFLLHPLSTQSPAATTPPRAAWPVSSSVSASSWWRPSWRATGGPTN